MNYYSNVKHHSCYCPLCLLERLSLGMAKLLLVSCVFLLIIIDDQFASRVSDKLAEREKKEEKIDE